MSTVAKVAKRPGPKTKPKSEQERARERAAQRKSNLERAKKTSESNKWVKTQLTKANKEFDRATRNAGPDVGAHSHSGSKPSWHTSQGRQELKRRQAKSKK